MGLDVNFPNPNDKIVKNLTFHFAKTGEHKKNVRTTKINHCRSCLYL